MTRPARHSSGADAAPARPAVDGSVLRHSVVLSYILRTFRREPALTVTLGYVLVVLEGIFYNYSYYQAFGIPVLGLSQINDFLVAGVQQPMALLIVLLIFPLVWGLDWINARARHRHALKLQALREQHAGERLPRYRLAYQPWSIGRFWPMWVLYPCIIAAYGSIFVGAYASYRADVVKSGNALHVIVWLAGDSAPLPSQAKSWTYLGATFNYVFLYDHISHYAQILPVNNIRRIEPVVRDPKTGDLLAPVR